MKLFKNLHKEQVDSMFKMAAVGISGHSLVFILIITMFYNIIGLKAFYFFLSSFILITAYRFVITWKYFKVKNNINHRKWLILYTIGAIISALIWSVGIIYITLKGIPLQYEFLLFASIVTIGAAAIATFGVVFHSYVLYSIALFVPYNVFLFFENSEFHLIIAILMFIALPFLLRASYSYSSSFSNLIENTTKILLKEKKFSDGILDVVVKILEEKDVYTVGHAARVSSLSVRLGKSLNLSEKELEILRKSSFLHDIGKIAIPDDILKKNSVLTDKEYEIIKSHSQKGYEILRIADNETINELLPVIKHHHERYDGLGYPDGLAKDEIPYFSRIISVVDTYDAMTSTRSYRNALPVQSAIIELERGKGRQSDPEICDLFIKIIQEEKNEQYKMSKLIEELENEHNTILDLFTTVMDNYENVKLAHNLLINIKEQLLDHLEKEDKNIYPKLKEAAKNDSEFKKSLDIFLNYTGTLPKIFDETIRVFSEEGKDAQYYKNQLEKLATKLYERIKKEEGIIFREFEERVYQIKV